MAWVKLASKIELAEGDVLGLEANGHEVALYCDKGEYFATSNVCTHQDALLSDGFFEDGCIECPLHQGRFDIRSGKALCEPVTEDLRIFPVKVEGEDIFADV
ncbi:MAG: 3-phenylpropionate/trans-cinnamate dioxygenase ferredoxin component [Burkholderiales bacterium]|jgi:3-phenylpropionate/trans-cinnamate dioxygenase ferredoxin subunit